MKKFFLKKITYVKITHKKNNFKKYVTQSVRRCLIIQEV